VDSRDELVKGRKYVVLTASRWPLETLLPTNFHLPWREMERHNAHIQAGRLHGWIKIETFEGIYRRLARDGDYLRILCGDFNTPQAELPDETTTPLGKNNDHWSRGELNMIRGIPEYDLPDMYRLLHGFDKQEASGVREFWAREHSRRVDHGFASRRLNRRTRTYLERRADGN